MKKSNKKNANLLIFCKIKIALEGLIQHWILLLIINEVF